MGNVAWASSAANVADAANAPAAAISAANNRATVLLLTEVIALPPLLVELLRLMSANYETVKRCGLKR